MNVHDSFPHKSLGFFLMHGMHQDYIYSRHGYPLRFVFCFFLLLTRALFQLSKERYGEESGYEKKKNVVLNFFFDVHFTWVG